MNFDRLGDFAKVSAKVGFRLRLQPDIATLLLLAPSSACCNDRLKSRPDADDAEETLDPVFVDKAFTTGHARLHV